MTKKLDKEKEIIDDYLNTATITLMAGFLVLFAIEEFNTKLSLWLAIISLVLFIMTFLFNLWYRYRKTLKNELLEEKTKECINKEIDSIVSYAELIKPIAEQKFLEIYAGTFTESKTVMIKDHQESIKRIELDEKFEKEMNKTYENSQPIVRSISENIVSKLFGIKNDILKKPLNEKNPRIKFIIDIMSFRTRYFIFCTGLLLFVISLILNNI